MAGATGCAVASDCPQMGPMAMICVFPTGTCPLPPSSSTYKWGSCQIRPQVCSKEYRPVCGCDFVTYGNACMARLNQTSILHLGACVGNGERCNDNTDCAAISDAFCRTSIGNCSPDAAWAGVCASPPLQCANETAQNVCSCTEKDYPTPCDAYAAGESIKSLGLCVENKTCFNDKDCGDFGYFCRYPTGQCHPTGVCTLKPEYCTYQYDPVCSCTGYTFGNDCAAAGAGANVWQKGACTDGS